MAIVSNEGIQFLLVVIGRWYSLSENVKTCRRQPLGKGGVLRSTLLVFPCILKQI